MEITQKELDIVKDKFINIDDLDKNIQNSKYSKTLKLFKNNVEKIDSLNLDLNKIESNYTSSCILRVIIEIYIIDFYIFNHLPNLKSDVIGETYYKEYFISEHFKRTMYNLGIEGILQGVTKNATFENLKQKFEEDIPDLTEKDVQEIHTKANMFDIRKIQKEVLNKPMLGQVGAIHDELLPGMLEGYNNLSSYIHSGPNAEIAFNKDPKNVSEAKEWGIILSFFSYTTFFILLNLDKKEFPDLLEYIDLKSKHFC